jgi:vacuolar-type H+-ATPase subunit I/STV1
MEHDELVKAIMELKADMRALMTGQKTLLNVIEAKLQRIHEIESQANLQEHRIGRLESERESCDYAQKAEELSEKVDQETKHLGHRIAALKDETAIQVNELDDRSDSLEANMKVIKWVLGVSVGLITGVLVHWITDAGKLLLKSMQGG